MWMKKENIMCMPIVIVCMLQILLAGTAVMTREAAADPNHVLVRVNGEDILQKDVDEIMTLFMLPEFNAKNPGKEMPEEQRQQVEKQILDQLVTERVLLQKAAIANITVDPKEVSDRIAQVKPQRPDLTDEQWTNFLTRDMTIQKLVQQEVVSKVTISDEDVQKFYDEQKDRFHEPEQIRASHILVQVPQDATPEVKDAAKKKIDGVLADVNAGKDFAELAKANSDDPGSKDNGGDLDFFPRGAMIKSFEDAAFALRDGEVSGVVETQFGYHIIKKTGEKAERDVPLNEVKDQLKGSLTKQKTNTEVMAWVESLKKQATIENEPSAQPTPATEYSSYREACLAGHEIDTEEFYKEYVQEFYSQPAQAEFQCPSNIRETLSWLNRAYDQLLDESSSWVTSKTSADIANALICGKQIINNDNCREDDNCSELRDRIRTIEDEMSRITFGNLKFPTE